jgi:UTP--glucose-1-phosphate uridylyltransferase
MEVKKAVIPAAGLGTRFLPCTKTIPKELLPIVDRPVVELIVEETYNSNIGLVIFITRRGKSLIEDHFELEEELQKKLISEGKSELAKVLNDQSNLVKVVSVRQHSPRGLGHAVLMAEHVVGHEPFAVLLGDDIFDCEVPATLQLIETFKKYKKNVVALMEVPREDIAKFGCASGPFLDQTTIQVESLVEKPSPAEAQSNYAVVGRYILMPEVFEVLKTQEPGKGGEIQLTDAIAKLIKTQGVVGKFVQGIRFDAGDKLGFLQANIHYALKNPLISDKLKDYVATKVKV